MPLKSDNTSCSENWKDLKLPVEMRTELKDPIGILLSGDPADTVKMLTLLLEEKQPPMFAVVGDFTAKNILEANLHPDIVIIDHRTMREQVDPLEHGEKPVWEAANPAGTITCEACKILEDAVTLKREVSVIVEGEEDLLVLPLIILMPVGSIIIYGQPREGMVAVEVDDDLKDWARDFMNRMEESK